MTLFVYLSCVVGYVLFVVVHACSCIWYVCVCMCADSYTRIVVCVCEFVGVLVCSCEYVCMGLSVL